MVEVIQEGGRSYTWPAAPPPPPPATADTANYAILPTDKAITCMTVDSSNNIIYATSYDGSCVYVIDPTTFSMVLIAGNPVSAGSTDDSTDPLKSTFNKLGPISVDTTNSIGYVLDQYDGTAFKAIRSFNLSIPAAAPAGLANGGAAAGSTKYLNGAGKVVVDSSGNYWVGNVYEKYITVLNSNGGFEFNQVLTNTSWGLTMFTVPNKKQTMLYTNGVGVGFFEPTASITNKGIAFTQLLSATNKSAGGYTPSTSRTLFSNAGSNFLRVVIDPTVFDKNNPSYRRVYVADAADNILRFIFQYNGDGTVSNVTPGNKWDGGFSIFGSGVREIAYVNGFILALVNTNMFCFAHESQFRNNDTGNYAGEPLTTGTGFWGTVGSSGKSNYSRTQVLQYPADPVHTAANKVAFNNVLGIVNHPSMPMWVYTFEADAGTLQLLMLQSTGGTNLSIAWSMFVCRSYDYNNTPIKVNGIPVQLRGTYATSIDPLTGHVYQAVQGSDSKTYIMRIPTVYTANKGTTTLDLTRPATYGMTASPVVRSSFNDGSFTSGTLVSYPIFQYNAANGLSKAMVNLNMYLVTSGTANVLLYIYNRANMFLPRLILPASVGWSITNQGEIDASFVLNNNDMFVLLPSLNVTYKSGTLVIEKMGVQAGGGRKRNVIMPPRKNPIPTIKTLYKKRRGDKVIVSDNSRTGKPLKRKTQKKKPIKLVV